LIEFAAACPHKEASGGVAILPCQASAIAMTASAMPLYRQTNRSTTLESLFSGNCEPGRRGNLRASTGVEAKKTK
jgi:hypothetical protein